MLTACEGDFEVTVDTAAPELILGTGQCSSPEYIWVVDVVGLMGVDPAANGDFNATNPTWGFADSWTGSFSGNHLNGYASGNSGVGFPWVEWTLEFDVER